MFGVSGSIGSFLLAADDSARKVSGVMGLLGRLGIAVRTAADIAFS